MGLLSSFLGKDQRKDITAANNQANQYLDTGYNAAKGYYDQAVSGYDPYVASGNKSQATWDDLMGLNGTAARDAAYGTLSTNPLFTGQLATSSNALARTLNAQGASGGGKAQLAGARVLAETGGNWLDRYASGGQLGLQATGAKSNALMGQGDMTTNYYGTKAGNAVNYGNALAASRNVGINNITSLLGTAINAATPARNGVSAFGNIKSGLGF